MENEHPSDAVETHDTPEVNDTLPTENDVVEAPTDAPSAETVVEESTDVPSTETVVEEESADAPAAEAVVEEASADVPPTENVAEEASTDAPPAETDTVEETAVEPEQPAAEPIVAAAEPEPEAVPQPSLLSRVEAAYHALQGKLAGNQQVIQENRTKIAALRSRMRELAADSQADANDGEDELHNGKLLVQHDSCGTLISQAEQIREHIYNNSGHAESLLAPLKASVELLDLRLQHVRGIEQLLENVKTGMALQDRLLDIDLIVESLANKLEVA
jgi:hypothetical protein